MVDLAWGWLHWQPDSHLSWWYQERFGHGSARLRKLGIGALARKLLVALWRLVAHGEIPPGAVLADWYRKVMGRGAKRRPVGMAVAVPRRRPAVLSPRTRPATSTSALPEKPVWSARSVCR